MIYDEIYEYCKKRTAHTVWVFSDLQQSLYENAKKCLDINMEDYELLGRPAEQMWYLGDSTESDNLPELIRMTQLQEDAFSRLGIPLCYATGNHDYDYANTCYDLGRKEFRMPFYEMVQNHPGWYTTKSCEDTWFKVPIGDTMTYFFCDHIARDNSWCSTHNQIRWGEDCYPYGEEHYASIRRDMEACEKKQIITAAHCAFPGGNRETHFLSLIQPLPMNVRLHIYGHAHIGEYRCPKERVFSQIQWIDWQDIPQVDIASFENIRGAYCKSAILQIYEDQTLGLFIRNHETHHFESAFFPAAASREKKGSYENRFELSKW